MLIISLFGKCNFKTRKQSLCVQCSHKDIRHSGRCPHINYMSTTQPHKKTSGAYRHGDLKKALLGAGLALARQGGPNAVLLREVTRQVGVVPNAAYRHYANQHDLLQAVRSAAMSALANAIESELAKLPSINDPADFARANLRAVGMGYLKFAQDEPGLFLTAFSVPDDLQGTAVPEKAGNSGLNPYQLLSVALDRLVDTGVLPNERRMGAEYLAWSAVHGLSMLFIDGPLRQLSPAQRQIVSQRLLDMVEKGLV